MQTGITPAEALRTVLDETPVLRPETVSVREALGRVLAAPVVSERMLPPADNSAMDGYAVRVADAGAAAPGSPVELRVVFEVAAGGASDAAVGPGQAARVLTGAPIPPGADAVVMVELTELGPTGESVRVERSVPKGNHIRPAGDDVVTGDVVLEIGTRLGAAHL
ncbi:MAG: gephyrin-like molybdotransferase Glp, partial [Myxococcota bacterium]